MAEDLTKFNDYTYESDLKADLVSKNSQLRAFDDYTDALGFDSQFEGTPAENIITGGIRIKKRKYSDGTTGIWMGIDSDGLAKINIGSATSYMTWDGTALNIAGSVVVGYIPTGGAAADVNAGATTISGGKITTGSIAADKISTTTLSAITANLGTITAGSLSAVSISGATITGTTLTSATSGQRIVINSSNLAIYNSSNALCGNLSGSTNGGINSVELTGSGTNSIVDINATGGGEVALQIDGATFLKIQGSAIIVNRDIEPVVPSNLGSATYPFVDFFLAGDMYSDGYINAGYFVNLARLTGAQAAALTAQNGSMYYRTDDNTIRVMRAGTWRTVTTS